MILYGVAKIQLERFDIEWFVEKMVSSISIGFNFGS